MPQAVTHILVPILFVAIVRDFYLRTKDRKSFPLHYVLAAGIGGILPDIDIVFSVFLYLLGIPQWDIHKTFFHSLFFPLIFFLLFLVLRPVRARARICNLTKHKLKLSILFLMIAIGVLIHIFLDALIGGPAFFFYPFSFSNYEINLAASLPLAFRDLITPLLDGIVLVIWIVYLELKHKISNFI